MTRVLISGTSGFIAPRIASKLLDAGHEVWGIERYVTGRTAYQKDVRLNKFFCDLNDHHMIRHIIRMYQPEAVFHLGAMSPVSFSYERPQLYIDTNFKATVNLAETCMREVDDFKHFIFAGTSEEYGNQKEFPIKESAQLYPNSPYAVSKVASDLYLNYMHDAYGFPVTVCRPYNTFGRTGTSHFVTERIISQCLRHEESLRLGDPAPVRDLLFRNDHVNAYLSVFSQPEKSIGETFNFCTGKGVSIRELVDLITKKTGYEGEVVWNTIPKRPLDIDCLIGDPAKAQQILKWHANYSLSEGLDQTITELKMHGRLR